MRRQEHRVEGLKKFSAEVDSGGDKCIVGMKWARDIPVSIRKPDADAGDDVNGPAIGMSMNARMRGFASVGCGETLLIFS